MSDYVNEKKSLTEKAFDFLKENNYEVFAEKDNTLNLTYWGEVVPTKVVRLYCVGNSVLVESIVEGDEASESDLFEYFSNDEMKDILRVFGIK